MSTFIQIRIRASALLLLALASVPAFAEEIEQIALPEASQLAARPDYLFPASGAFAATLASGLPFLGIAELAYGISRRFSIGAFVGATPDMPSVDGTLAIGIRPRAVLYQTGPWRITLVASLLVYPDVSGFGHRVPWVLARPTAAIERELFRGLRVNAGLGFIVTSSLADLFTADKPPASSDWSSGDGSTWWSEPGAQGSSAPSTTTSWVPTGIWNTAALVASLPLSDRVTCFLDASLILKGVMPAHDWLGGMPLVAYGGVSIAL